MPTKWIGPNSNGNFVAFIASTLSCQCFDQRNKSNGGVRAPLPQGRARHVFGTLGLPAQAFAIDGVEYYGNVGYLKGGLATADAITTVSPTYAQEICTPEYGMGLDGLISNRAGVLHGIVNGIDTDEWNPASDPLIPATYGARRLSARRRNRRSNR